MNHIVRLAVCFSICSILGCGGNPNLGKVTGTITLDGQPLADATIVFTPDSGGSTSFGKSDSSGYYKMVFSDTEDGAWIGASKVSIRTGDVLPDNSGVIPEKVPNVYNTRSTLTAEVKTGSNTFDWKLESKAGKIEQMRAGY